MTVSYDLHQISIASFGFKEGNFINEYYFIPLTGYYIRLPEVEIEPTHIARFNASKIAL